jgi:hypothetical protein
MVPLAPVQGTVAANVARDWIWQGSLSKPAGSHPGEIALMVAAGRPETAEPAATRLLGAAEVVLGLVFLLRARQRWPQRIGNRREEARRRGVLAKGHKM